MRAIFRIARQECRTFFYSPIAWLVWVLFAIQVAYDFITRAREYESGARMGGTFSNLTMEWYPAPMGFFGYAEGLLILYIPLLTMGLMSREYHSGSIRLLQSSPLRSGEIVMGKFLGIMAFASLLLLVPAGLALTAGPHIIDSQDLPVVLSGLLALWLLTAAYCAIGLFLSSLTQYQVVAAISTIAVFAAMKAVGTLWQNISFVRDITYYISISFRTADMSSGLIVSRDVSYFLLLQMLFLTLMYLRLESSRETRPWTFKAARYAMAVVLFLALVFVTSRPGLQGFADVTDTKSRTLMPASQEIMKKIKGPLKVHIYTNLLDPFKGQGMPSSVIGNINLFEQYRRMTPDIDIDYTYYYDTCDNPRFFKEQAGKTMAQMADLIRISEEFDDEALTPEAMRKKIDLEGEGHRLVRRLEANGKSTYVRVFSDIIGWPLEAELSAGLGRLTKPVQTIAFVTGHGERSIDKLGDEESWNRSVRQQDFRFSLLNYGFDITTLSLASGDIPQAVSILAIADPQIAFTTAELDKLRRYIDGGGNLFIAGEPGRQAVLNDVLTAGTGVRYMAGALAEQSKDASPAYVRGLLTDVAASRWEGNASARAGGLTVEMPGAMALAVDGGHGFKVDTLVATRPGMVWNRKEADAKDTSELRYQPERGDEKAVFPLVAALSRRVGTKEQRIVICGDADFMNNAALRKCDPITQGIVNANYDITRHIFSWLSGNAYPVDVTRPKPIDNKILITEEGVHRLKYLFLWIVPALIAAAGAVLLIYRKAK